MASKYLSGTYNAGYTLNAAYTAVTIGTTAAIGGGGLVGNASPDTVVDLGQIAATSAGAAGISLTAGGTVSNGSSSDTTALIAGGGGSYSGAGGAGIALSGAGIIDNWGSVAGGSGGAGRSALYDGGPGGRGGAGLILSNGSIGNAGTITGGDGGTGGDGFPSPFTSFDVGSGGTGGAGGVGVTILGSATIANTGTVKGGNGEAGGNQPKWFGGIGGAGGAGMSLSGGGNVTNSDTIGGGAGGSGGRGGQSAGAGGDGGAGIDLSGGGTIANAGTIIGGLGGAGGSGASAGTAGAGILISAGGTVTNGSAALITGGTGVRVRGAVGATVVNYGKIASLSGPGGAAIDFGNSASLLVLEGGSTLYGYAAGGGGTLALGAGGGAGALSGLGSQYRSFSQYVVVSGGDWTLSGGNTISSGGTLTDSGRLIDAGQLHVASGGMAIIAGGGTLELAAGGTLTGAVTFSGAGGDLQIDGTTMPTATIGGLVPADTLDLAAIPFDAAGSATLEAGNVLQVDEGGTLYRLNLDPSQDFSGYTFRLTPDSAGGTQILETVPLRFALGNFAPNAGGWTSQDAYPRALGDVNGDGRADIVGFASDGTYESLATGGGDFAGPILATSAFGTSNGWTSQNTYPREVADVNGDGRADLVGFGSDGVYVSLATGGGNFAGPILASTYFGAASGWTSQDQYPRQLADLRGDGREDIVAFASDGVYVSLSNGDGTFAAPIRASASFGTDNGWTSQDAYPRELADVNGDGKADIVGFGAGGAYVGLGNGDGTFAAPVLATSAFGTSNGWTSQDAYPRELADVNGDGKADIVGFGSDGTYSALGNGDGTFGATVFDFNSLGADTASGGWTSQNTYPRLTGDVTGDGRADIVAFASDGVYTVLFPTHGT